MGAAIFSAGEARSTLPAQGEARDRVDSWKQIAAYLGRNERTVIRWEKERGLPVHRVPGNGRSAVFAYRRELDEWLAGAGDAQQANAAGGSGLGEFVWAGASAAGSGRKGRIGHHRIPAIAAASVLACAAITVAWRVPLRGQIEIASVTQLSQDGIEKRHLVTDGRELYFVEVGGERFELSVMAADGGPIRRLRVPFPEPRPIGVDREGKNLLVASMAGHEEDRPLWVVPAGEGKPREIPGAKCHTAAWSPDGTWIACTRGEAIYLITTEGAESRLLAHTGGVPQDLLWSADGKHLLFLLPALGVAADALWQVDLDASLQVERMGPIRQPNDAPWQPASLLAESANGYIAVEHQANEDRLMWVRPSGWWRAGSLTKITSNSPFMGMQGLAADRGADRLFIIGGGPRRGQLARYDAVSQSFKMLLPGVAASYLDISRTTGMFAYMNSMDGSLWVSRNDGSGARQLSPAGEEVELPRFSPDGRQIAYMGKQPGRPYRIFVVATEGGPAREASQGEDNQGAPTWLPDAKHLAYGNVHCQEERGCAIHVIDLASGKATTIPGSEGLGTARCSPDGRYLAALNPTEHTLVIFDHRSPKWRTLSGSIDGNDVSWSADSRWVYSRTSVRGQPEIVRVAAEGGAVHPVLNLDAFSRAGGELDEWFSLTPDNAILLNRWMSSSEIYALKLERR